MIFMQSWVLVDEENHLFECINKLANPNSGEVDFKGEKLLSLKGQKLKKCKETYWDIFQNLI